MTNSKQHEHEGERSIVALYERARFLLDECMAHVPLGLRERIEELPLRPADAELQPLRDVPGTECEVG